MSDPRSPNPSKWLVLAVLAVALFMMNLDVTIVNIALPHIMTGLKASLSDAEWVINVYILVFAVSLITMGRLGDIFGRKRFFLMGLVLFTVSSFVCGLAGNIGLLIAARALQGFGGAAMMPATLSLLNVAFKDGQRGQAMGVWGAVSGAASALGPIIGGALVDKFSWGSIFLVNVPFGILALVAGARIIGESTEPNASRRIDWPGILSASVGLFCLTFALVEGQKYGWGSALIVSLFVAAFLGLMLFVIIERRSRAPLIELSLFRKVNFSAGNVLSSLLMFGLIGIIFLLVLFLQAVLGFSAIKTGLVLLPMPVAVMFAAPLAGRVAERSWVRWVLAGGMLLTAIAVYLFAHLSPTTTWQSLVLPLVLAGIGMGLVMAPTNTVVMASAPVEKSGAASGIMTTTRQVGALLGVAVLGAVLQSQLVTNLTRALSNVAGLPAPVKAAIIDAINKGGATSGMNMAGVPAGAQAEIGQMFAAQFAASLNSAMKVAVIFCLAGAVVALFVRGTSTDKQPVP
jgi:EmrB/QacA subfamily drug resistance transporter